MVGPVYLVSHCIPARCVPSQHSVEYIVSTQDTLVEERPSDLHPNIFSFLSARYLLSWGTLYFRVSLMIQSWAQERSLARAV